MARLLLMTVAVMWVLISACGDEEQPTGQASTMTPIPSTPGSSEPVAPAAVEVGELAYVGTDGALWLRDGSGRTSPLYAPANGFIYFPEWSPDGTKLAFTEVAYADPGPQTGYADVMSAVVVDETGREWLRIARATLPHWSPDGKSLSLLLEPRVGDLTFFGTPHIADVGTGDTRRLLDELQIYDAPRWRPDGQFLAYATGTSLFMISAEGETAPVILASGDETYYSSPVWSDDGQVLAFERDRSAQAPPEPDSYIAVDPESGSANRVPEGNPNECGRELWLRDFEARWVPGSSLAIWSTGCHTGAPRPVGLWVKEMVAPGEERLIETPVLEGVGIFDISPDGDSIAVSDRIGSIGIGLRPSSSPPPDAREKIYLVPRDGGDIRLLVDGGRFPVWRPTP